MQHEMSDAEDRFYDQVRVGDGCWEWTGRLDKDGYGSSKAHAKAWKFANGPIPEGMCICHRCDNRKCVRPSHLFLGTNRENIADRNAKGRQASGDGNGARLHPERLKRGHEHPSALLDAPRVRGIVALVRAGMRHWEVAKMYGVTRSSVTCIMRGAVWSHVTGLTAPISSVIRVAQRLTEEKVLEIRRRVAAGESALSIGREMRLKSQTVHNVIYRKRWRNI